MSWKSEVIAERGDDAQWASNSLRFATQAEAEAYVADLSYRWTLVRKTRVVESKDPVNYRWKDGRAEPLEQDK